MQKITPAAKKPYKPKARTRLPNGFGSVTTLPGNRRRPFAARKTIGWNDKGQPIQKTIGYYETWMEAFEALSAYNHNPYDLEAASATFAQVYERWSQKKFSEVRNGKTLSEQGKSSYRAAFKHFSEIHSSVLRNLTAADLQNQVDKCPRGLSTQENMIILIGQIYSYAIEHDIVQKDISPYVHATKANTTPEKVPFSQAEIDILWQHAGDPAADILLVLLYSGMRISEFLQMRKDQIHIAERYMVGGLKTEAGRERIIPIHNKTIPCIERLMDKWESETIFPGTYYSFLNKFFEPLMKALGMSHTTHDCRHTFVTQADNIGVNDTIQKMIIGHARKGVTKKVYTHKTIQQLIDAVNLICY